LILSSIGDYGEKKLRLAVILASLFWLLLFGRAAADDQPKTFTQVGRWTLLKYPEGCALLAKDFDNYLWARTTPSQSALRLIDTRINLAPGDYPIGIEIGNPVMNQSVL